MAWYVGYSFTKLVSLINKNAVLIMSCIIQGMKNFSPTAANLLAAITKIDNSYYPEVFTLSLPKITSISLLTMQTNSVNMYLQTLHQMYIVNAGPGFRKMLWPAAQKFLDAKTIAKIQVKNIYYNILLAGFHTSSVTKYRQKSICIWSKFKPDTCYLFAYIYRDFA